jgi:hypothetical protein
MQRATAALSSTGFIVELWQLAIVAIVVESFIGSEVVAHAFNPLPLAAIARWNKPLAMGLASK